VHRAPDIPNIRHEFDMLKKEKDTLERFRSTLACSRWNHVIYVKWIWEAWTSIVIRNALFYFSRATLSCDLTQIVSLYEETPKLLLEFPRPVSCGTDCVGSGVGYPRDRWRKLVLNVWSEDNFTGEFEKYASNLKFLKHHREAYQTIGDLLRKPW